MNKNYLLWAVGPDHAGIVAAVAKILFQHRCNLEDSSMMRLGAEFGMFVLFSSNKQLANTLHSHLKILEKKLKLEIGIKPISHSLAQFIPLKKQAYRVTLYGSDKPGLVYSLTSLLATHRFNISDLQTHRTNGKQKAGYILFIEGDLPSKKSEKSIKNALINLEKKLGVTIRFESLDLPVF